MQAEEEADMGGRERDESCTEVEMSPSSKISPAGQMSSSSVREKIRVFSSMDSADKVSPASAGTPGTAGTGTGAYRNLSVSRGWSQADEREVKNRAEQSSASAKEALAHFGRSPRSGGGGGGGFGSGSGSRPDKSWVKSGVKGPDTAGGSSSAGGSASSSLQNGGPTTSAAVAAAAAAAAVAKPAPMPLSNEQRRAFVKQYSQSDYEGESDYSIHDNAAAAAIAATFGGPDTTANGNRRPSPVSAATRGSGEIPGSGAAAAAAPTDVKNMSDSESPHLLK